LAVLEDMFECWRATAGDNHALATVERLIGDYVANVRLGAAA
jgi:hypothetical protein